MSETTMTKALVFAILRHAGDFPWRMQDTGLMGLRLDERREYRLHVWDPSLSPGDPPIHDHPYDFTSSIIVGELTNTRYLECATGDEHLRFRYSRPDEEQRRSDTVRLSATAETLREGDEYCQLGHELHASRQQPGTVSLIRCSWRVAGELTVCLPDETSWRSGQARDATRDEIKSMATKALEWF
jgi:hypothetical protein